MDRNSFTGAWQDVSYDPMRDGNRIVGSYAYEYIENAPREAFRLSGYRCLQCTREDRQSEFVVEWKPTTAQGLDIMVSCQFCDTMLVSPSNK